MVVKIVFNEFQLKMSATGATAGFLFKLSKVYKMNNRTHTHTHKLYWVQSSENTKAITPW